MTLQRTKIEYLTHSWNPIAMRCTPVSDGCRNCWHLAMAKRLAKNQTIPEKERLAYASGPQILREKELEAPLHLRKPSRIGVQFMGDLFHESIPFDFKLQIWLQIEASRQHKFMILTKRPTEMKDFFDFLFWHPVQKSGLKQVSNLWLGVSVEDQKTSDERIPILLQIQAAHHFISVEPMLSNIHIWKYYFSGPLPAGYEGFIDWVICGGETGPGARPLHPEWVRSLRDQCQAVGVPFFFKNWGDHSRKAKCPCGCRNWKIKGHLLDGKEWREIPKEPEKEEKGEGKKG